MFAVAGYDGSKYLNTVEEWVEESSTWKATNSLAEPRGYYGSTVAPKELVCPV